MKEKSIGGHRLSGIRGTFVSRDLETIDILSTLKVEHEELMTLLDNLTNTRTPARRRKLVQKIRVHFVVHTTSEEKIVYREVIAMRDKAAQLNALDACLEHKCIMQVVRRLETMPNSASIEHKAAAQVLKKLIERHIEDEERNVWEDVKNHFSEEDRKRLNEAFLAAKRRAGN